MAGSKLTELTDIATSVTGDDLVYIVDAPGGTPSSKKVTLNNLLGSINSSTPSVLNVCAYGAVGDGVTDDTAAIKAAIAAAKASSKVATVKIPNGRYLISSALVLDYNYARIYGDGQNSIIYNAGTGNAVEIKSCYSPEVRWLSIEGNNASGNGLDLSAAHYSRVTGCRIVSNGGHGIYVHGENYQASIDGNQIVYNLGDGINSIAAAGEYNGQAMTVTNNLFLANTGDGLRWSALGLNFTGNLCENNGGAGIHIDVSANIRSAFAIAITGNYFESNLNGQVRLTSGGAGGYAIQGVEIAANFFSCSTGTPTALIMGNAGASMLQQVNVANTNAYFDGGTVTHYVDCADGLDAKSRIDGLYAAVLAKFTGLGLAEVSYGGTGTGLTVHATSPTLTTPVLGAATATSIAIGANTLTTAEWANLDGVNQTLATTSTPQFARLGVGAAAQAGYSGIFKTLPVGIGVLAPSGMLEIVQDNATNQDTVVYVTTYSVNDDTDRSQIVLRRARTNTFGAQGLVTADNDVGGITFQASDGVSWQSVVEILVEMDTVATAAGDMPGRIVFKVAPDGSVTPVEVVRITNAGNVRIGSTAAAGTNATKTLVIETGTATSTSPSDATQLYSADQTAGNACLHARSELGHIVKLYQSMAHVADPTNDGETQAAVATIIDGLKALGLMAPDP